MLTQKQKDNFPLFFKSWFANVLNNQDSDVKIQALINLFPDKIQESIFNHVQPQLKADAQTKKQMFQDNINKLDEK